jgi:hypothetical protein
VQRDSGNTSTSTIWFSQAIETVNSYPFAGKAVAYSFYARAGANFSAASSNLNVRLRWGTGTDQNPLGSWTGGGFTVSTTATLTTSWQRFTFTGTVDATATELAAYVGYDGVGTAGAADYFEMTGVQLEVGSVATAFSRAGGTIQGELAACQRYYQRPATASLYAYYGTGVSESATASVIFVPLITSMRTNGPTTVDFSNLAQYDGSTVRAVTTLTIVHNSSNGVALSAASASGLTTNRPSALINNNSGSAYFGLSAEL